SVRDDEAPLWNVRERNRLPLLGNLCTSPSTGSESISASASVALLRRRVGRFRCRFRPRLPIRVASSLCRGSLGGSPPEFLAAFNYTQLGDRTGGRGRPSRRAHPH